MSDVSPPGRRSTHEDPPRHSDDEVDYLLSAGRLGGSQRERIFAAVASSLPQEMPSRQGRARRPHRWIGLAGLTLAAAASFVIWSRGSFERDHFQRKGQRGGDAPAVNVECLRATLAACPRGALLVFSASGASASMFVTAFLEPSGATPRVWLLSNEPISARAQAPGPLGLLARGARIPRDQPPGTYPVKVLVTRRPLSRDQAASPRPEQVVTDARFKLTVVP